MYAKFILCFFLCVRCYCLLVSGCWCRRRRHRRHRHCTRMMLISLSLHVITFVGVYFSVFNNVVVSFSFGLQPISLQLYKRSNIVSAHKQSCYALHKFSCLHVCVWVCWKCATYRYIFKHSNKCVFLQSAKALLSQRSQCRRMQK